MHKKDCKFLKPILIIQSENFWAFQGTKQLRLSSFWTN